MTRKLILILFMMVGVSKVVFSQSASATSTPSSQPTAQAEKFFDLLSKGDVDEAYDSLLTGSEMYRLKPQEMDNIKKQTSVMISSYGKILGFERIKTVTWGTCLVRYYYVVKSEKTPLTFYITYYLPEKSKAWVVEGFKFNDNTSFLPI